MNLKISKGFTLIELLVVIAIVTVLSAVVVITLNPAELLRQARDSNRVSDLATVNSAIALYLADVSSTSLGTASTCYVSLVSGGGTNPAANCGMGGTYTAVGSSSAANQRKVDATGWVPVNFSAISSGAPVGNLPVDPINNATYYYAYAATSTNSTFEVDANLESTKYANGGAGDLENTDGGNSSGIYEVGNAANKPF